MASKYKIIRTFPFCKGLLYPAHINPGNKWRLIRNVKHMFILVEIMAGLHNMQSKTYIAKYLYNIMVYIHVVCYANLGRICIIVTGT